MARFSEPDRGSTTSATRTTHGHKTRVVVTRPCAGRLLLPAARLPARFPSRGPVWRRAALAAHSEEGVARGSVGLRRGPVPCGLEAPAHPEPRTSMSRENPFEKADPFEPTMPTPDARTLAGRASRGLQSGTDPRRSARSHEDRGAFGHRAPRAFVKITPHVRPRGPPVHATRSALQ